MGKGYASRKKRKDMSNAERKCLTAKETFSQQIEEKVQNNSDYRNLLPSFSCTTIVLHYSYKLS